MHTRISRLADKTMEAAVLAAMLTIPLFFNPYSARVFEGEKVSLLQALAAIAAAAWLIRYVEEFRTGRRSSVSVSRRASPRLRGRLRFTALRERPVILAVLLIGLVTVIAGFTSITPRLTLWGSYQRGQGFITIAGYLVLLFVTLNTFGSPDKRRRLVTTLLVASAPVALIAFLQFAGLNPVPLQSLDSSRVFGTLSNPIFLGAYLVMVMPLTLAQIVRYGFADGGVRWGGLAGCIVLLVFQLAAAVFSGSRGPLMGVASGGFLFVFLLALQGRRRLVAIGLLCIAVLGLASLVVLSLPNTSVASLQNAPVAGRFSQALSTGSGRVRVLIWQGVVTRFAKEPTRLVLGYGPESTQAALVPTYQPELRHLEPERLPDRAHNVFLQALVTTGLVGAVSVLLLFAALFYTGLRALGLVATTRSRNQWLALTAAGVVAGVLLPWLITGNWTFAGLGVGLGLPAGLAAYLILRLWQLEPGDDLVLSDRAILVACILAALTGHLVEVSVGIRVTATESVFWVLAGLLVALSMTHETPVARSRGQLPKTSGQVTLIWDPEPAALGLLGGLMLSTLAFGVFLLPGAGVSASAVGQWAGLFGAWVLAGVLWLSPPDADARPGTAWIFPLVSVAWAGLFLALRRIVPVLGGDALTLLNVYFVWLLLSLAIVVVLLPRPPASAGALRAWVALAYPVLGAVALGLVAWLAVKPLYADLYVEAAQASAAAGQQVQALGFYRKAVEESPDVDVYQQYLGEAFVAAARVTGDPSQRDAIFQAGQEAFQRAVMLNPAEATHRFNQAHLYLLWAQATTDSDRQATLLKRAAMLYAQVASQTPLDPRVLAEWGRVLEAQGDVDAALARYREAIAVDPRSAQAYLQMGILLYRTGKTDEALRMYQQAIKLDPERVEAYRALADLYRQEGRLMDAVAAQQRAAELQPTDYTIHQNLALLYRDLGQLQSAVAEARLALTYAPPDQQQALQSFVQSLLASSTP